MKDPRQIAAQFLGMVEWKDDVTGNCHCPGESLHTHPTRLRDCTVHLDGAPTIHCFHHSCSAQIAAANLQLRRALAGSNPRRPLSMTLPARNRDEDERAVLERVRTTMEAKKAAILEEYRWPYADIVHDSPVFVADLSPEAQFNAWLDLWPDDANIWIGNIYNSGRPEYRQHFRPASAWRWIGPTAAYTCASSFSPGVFRRGNDEVATRHFLVVESDTLSRDEVGAVFAYLQRRLGYSLRCIIDTGGKSLHGWFNSPENKRTELRLKAGLTALGCDPKMFNLSQPVRCPGVPREKRFQQLIWLRGPERTAFPKLEHVNP